jgi:hypothetical protein
MLCEGSPRESRRNVFTFHHSDSFDFEVGAIPGWFCNLGMSGPFFSFLFFLFFFLFINLFLWSQPRFIWNVEFLPSSLSFAGSPSQCL